GAPNAGPDSTPNAGPDSTRAALGAAAADEPALLAEKGSTGPGLAVSGMGAHMGARSARTCSRPLSPARPGTALTLAKTHSCRPPPSEDIPGGQGSKITEPPPICTATRQLANRRTPSLAHRLTAGRTLTAGTAAAAAAATAAGMRPALRAATTVAIVTSPGSKAASSSWRKCRLGQQPMRCTDKWGFDFKAKQG